MLFILLEDEKFQELRKGRRVTSSGIQHRIVRRKSTDVSDENAASIFKDEE
jgi:hypothetical protein